MAFQRENLQIWYQQPKVGIIDGSYITNDTWQVVSTQDYFSYSLLDESAVKFVIGSTIRVISKINSTPEVHFFVVTEVIPNGNNISVRTKRCQYQGEA